MRKVTPQALAKAPFQLPDVVTKVVPAPTGGWDAISPLAEMDPKRAPILNNWVPRPGWVEIRPGYDIWSVTNSGAPVETLLPYRPANGTEKLFAASDAHIYDVSTNTNATSVVSGSGSARYQYVMFSPAGNTNSYLQCVNGVDQLRQYDGTSWTQPTITGFPNGLTTANIFNIAAQKRRLWYVMGNGAGGRGTIAAFMPTDAISGPIAGYIDFAALWNKGGYLLAMADWTVDGGSGPQDYVAFISSRGQVSLYAGTDPTNSAAWSLVGTFDLSVPISDRCVTRVGSDDAIITQAGVIPLSQSLPFDPSADRSIAITARIQNAMVTAAQTAATNFGWQVIAFPAQTLAIINVPLTTNQNQVQYVMNTITGAWCQFTGWNANHFEIFQDALYFGGNDGNVYLTWQGSADNATPITAEMQLAYNYFDDPGREKRITMVQPVTVTNAAVTVAMAVDVDFGTSSFSAPVSLGLIGSALWDTAIWDSSSWPGTSAVFKPWTSVQAIGHALAIHMVVSITDPNAATIATFDVGQFDIAAFDSSHTNNPTILQVDAFNAIMELGSFI